MEKKRRKRWIAGALAFAMCCTTLFSAGTSAAAAGADGIYQESAQTEEQTEKSEEELFSEKEADPELALTVYTGDAFEIKKDFTGLKLKEGEKAKLKWAEMEDGTAFDPEVPGTYKCVYEVTPVQGEAYLIARNITVTPREAETNAGGEKGSGESEDGGESDGEADPEAQPQTETEPVSEAGLQMETETLLAETVEAQTEPSADETEALEEAGNEPESEETQSETQAVPETESQTEAGSEADTTEGMTETDVVTGENGEPLSEEELDAALSEAEQQIGRAHV